MPIPTGIRNPYQRRALEKQVQEPEPETKKSAYDIRRQQIRAEGSQDAEREREALQRSLASQGITDSGIRLAQERTQDVQNRLATGRALTEVDVQELLSEEERARELQRQGFLSSERMGSQEFQRELEGGRLGLSREQMALQRELEGGRLGLSKEQLALQRELGIGSQELQRQSMEQQGRQFERGLEASAREGQLNREQQISMVNLNATLQKDFLTFQDLINDANKAGDEQSAIKMLALSEKIAALDPKDPKFTQKLNEIIASASPGAAGIPPERRGLPDQDKPYANLIQPGDEKISGYAFYDKDHKYFVMEQLPDGTWRRRYY